MADQQEQRNDYQQHQQQETDSEPARTPAELEFDESSNDEAQEANITSIYYDCLEHIFDYLNFESLLSVAQTCRRLQIAAAAKFRDDFDGKRIELYLYRPNDWQSGIYCLPNCIFIVNLKFCLPFLRCFGAKITELLVDYSGLPLEQCGRVNQYISEFCADTLTKTVLLGQPVFSIELIQKPFKNVTSVTICEARIENQLSTFVDWLPNLRRLKLNKVELSTDDVVASFPQLEHLSFTIAPEASMGHLTYNQAVHLLNANRQLHSLKIISYYVMDVGMIKDSNELIRFANEHPLIDDLDMRTSILKADNAISIFRQLNSLKHFGFLVQDQSEHDHLLNNVDEAWQHNAFPIYGDNIVLFYTQLSR